MATKIQQEKVTRWVEKWKVRMLLTHWSVLINFADEAKDSSKFVVADMTPNARYTDAVLRIYPGFWKEPANQQQAIIVHELAHNITDSVNDQLIRLVDKKLLSDTRRQDILEGVTEHLSKVMYRAYKVK